MGYYPIAGRFSGKVVITVTIPLRYTSATLSATSANGSIYGDKGSGLAVTLSNGMVSRRSGVCYIEFDCSPSYSTVLTTAHSGYLSIDSTIRLLLS